MTNENTMCSDRILYSPRQTGLNGIALGKKGKPMNFQEVQRLVDAIRYVASSRKMSIADTTELLRRNNAFPAIYKVMTPNMTSRQLANKMRGYIID